MLPYFLFTISYIYQSVPFNLTQRGSKHYHTPNSYSETDGTGARKTQYLLQNI